MAVEPDVAAQPAPAARGPAFTRGAQWWSLGSAIILSLAALATAWCGFEANQWNSQKSGLDRSASVSRSDAARQGAIADRQTSNDVLLFTAWITATVSGNETGASAVAERFRAELRPAFEAWLAPGSPDGLPPGSPFDREEYLLSAQIASQELIAQAEAYAAQADEAGSTSSSYVLATVLYASVLFLAGIAEKLRTPWVSRLMVGLSAAMGVAAVAQMISLPVRW